MSGWYEIGVTCAVCETPLEHGTSGKSNGFETTTVLFCPAPDCGTQWSVHVQLLQMRGKWVPPVDGAT